MPMLELLEQYDNDVNEPLWAGNHQDIEEGLSSKQKYAAWWNKIPLRPYCFPLTLQKADDSTSSSISLATSCGYYMTETEPQAALNYEWLKQPAINVNGNIDIVEIVTKYYLPKEPESIMLDAVINNLWEIYAESSIENWDGYGALPIPKAAINEAIRMLNLIPSSVPLPEIVPEPNGNIALEWYKDKAHVFIASLSGKNTISYAGIFGGASKSYGTEDFSERIPKAIIRNIDRIFEESRDF